MDALSLSPSVDGTAASSNAPSTLVVAAPPSVPMAPIDAAARAVANSSQTPTGDASKSTGKRKTMEQQTELSTTCPVCKHTAGHNGGSIVTAPCCEKQLYCRACVTDLITKGCKSCLGCTNKLQPLRDFKPFRVSEIESPAVRAIVQDHFDISHRCDMTTAPTPAAAALAPHQKQIVAALMQKLKDKHFPALPDWEIPTRKVIPLPGQRHPGTLISSPSQPRPLTPHPLPPRPLSHPPPHPLSPSGLHAGAICDPSTRSTLTPHPPPPVQMLPVLYRMTEEPPKPIVMEMSPRTWTQYQDSSNLETDRLTKPDLQHVKSISLFRTSLHVTLRRCQTRKQPTARQAKHSASLSGNACKTTKASRSTGSHQLEVL